MLQDSVLGPILFTMDMAPMNRILQRHGVSYHTYLTRFNKIVISNYKFQDKDAIGLSRAQNFYHLCIALLNICQFFFLKIFTLLALTQSFDSLFHSFITLCENEYFLMSNLHYSLTNAALCPLILLPSLCL